MRILALCCCCALILAADGDRERLRAELNQAADEASALSRAFRLVHELAAPSVVSIHTREQFRVINRWEMRAETREVDVGEGSGFVFHTSEDTSYILTNAHVVTQTNAQQQFQRQADGTPVTYDRITVATNDNRQFEARIVGVDIQSDLAVLAISATLPAILWGDSDVVHVGDWVLAEGYPFGKGYSATAGIVSATDRSTGIYSGVKGFEAFIQTDASINPGNSGGPLFDLRGQVIGVNANIISPTGTSAGLGFAIPSNLARRVAEDLMDDGKLSRPMIGVEVQELAPEAVASLGLPRIHTLAIARILPGSPAEQGGLQAGDIVMAINTLPIVNWQQFRSKIASTRPGELMRFTIWRTGEQKQVEVRPVGEDELANRVGVSLPGYGMMVGTDDKPGLVILHVEDGGLANRAGLRPNDRILHERSIGALTDVDSAKALAERRELVVQVIREGQTLWLRMRR